MRMNQSAIRCRDRGGGTRCWQGKKPVEDEESEEEITTSAPPSKQVSEVGRNLVAPSGMELTPEMEAAIRAALEKQAGGGPDPEEFIKTLQPSGTPGAAHAPTWPPWTRHVAATGSMHQSRRSGGLTRMVAAVQFSEEFARCASSTPRATSCTRSFCRRASTTLLWLRTHIAWGACASGSTAQHTTELLRTLQEANELEQAFLVSCAPLFVERLSIICGDREPTTEELDGADPSQVALALALFHACSRTRSFGWAWLASVGLPLGQPQHNCRYKTRPVQLSAL